MSLLLATLAGGVVLFAWGAVCWMVLPHHHDDYRGFSDEGAVSAGLRKGAAGPGAYWLPFHTNYEGGMKDPALEARHREGPNAVIVVYPSGPCMVGSTFLKGFLLNLGTAFVAAVLFVSLRDAVPGLLNRILLFGGLGALIHAVPLFQQSIWLQWPWRNALTCVFDGIVGFALLGFVMHFLA
ncbi:MAG: hypothetical protein ACT4PV_13255 [Planctomycetaceae bacterium]